MRRVRIRHRGSGALIAEGPIGWGVTPFDGGWYIRDKYLHTKGFRSNHIPGICPYKLLYVWLDYTTEDGDTEPSLGWRYWLPNPLLPFTWFRVAVPRSHPALVIEEFDAGT